MSGNARNWSTWSSGRHTPRSSYCAQLPVAEATISPSAVRSHAQPRASKYCSSTSIGAPSSRSSWISSSLRIMLPGSPWACRRPLGAALAAAAPATLASSAAMRAFSASFSSRAAAAIAFTASNSSRPTKSLPAIHSRIFSRARASASRPIPAKVPAKPFTILTKSSNILFSDCIATFSLSARK